MIFNKISSIWDEAWWKSDSFTTSSLYKINTISTSYGSLSLGDYKDYYEIVPGIGTFQLVVTTEGMNSLSNTTYNYSFEIKIVDSLGRQVLASDIPGPDIYSDSITFTSRDYSTYYVEITNSFFGDFQYAATLNSVSSGGGGVSDSTAPSLSSVSPVDGATGVAVDANFVLTFNEAVKSGTGSFVVKNGSTTVATIAVTDTSQVSFNGSTVTINPTSNLDYSKSYSVSMAAGVIKDIAGNDWSGTGTNPYDFTTVAPPDTTAPSLSSASPADEATAVSIGANVVVAFSEAIQRGAGSIVLKRADGTTVATYPQSSTEVTVSGSTLTINPATDLAYATGYRVEFAAGSVQDLAGNNYAGTTSYNFTTAAAPDTTAPTVTAFSPADEATAVAIGANVVVTFSEAIQRGAGSIILKKADGTTVATYAQSSTEVTVSGSTLTINPASDLSYSTGYTVEFAAGAVQDLAGNNYAGTSSYNFTTKGVAIRGTVAQGQVLTASNSLTDADGIPATGAGAISYQWKANGSNIAGATASTYTLTQAEVGKAITVVASYTDSQGTAESVTSSATAAVANVNDAPGGGVSISGTATQGQLLTASNSLTDADGIPTTGAGAISYQWKAGGSNIAGATASTYTLTQAEVGKAITVVASYVDLFGKAESLSSSATSLVSEPNLSTGQPKFWKDATKIPSEVNKADAVNLTDAISILKMIVGLPVNTGNQPLSTYQSVAADFNQNGSVGLEDAIGVLKHVVGLVAPLPTWRFLDAQKLPANMTTTQGLEPGTWIAPALVELSQMVGSVAVVGVLTGDVDGSWIG